MIVDYDINRSKNRVKVLSVWPGVHRIGPLLDLKTPKFSLRCVTTTIDVSYPIKDRCVSLPAICRDKTPGTLDLQSPYLLDYVDESLKELNKFHIEEIDGFSQLCLPGKMIFFTKVGSPRISASVKTILKRDWITKYLCSYETQYGHYCVATGHRRPEPEVIEMDF